MATLNLLGVDLGASGGRAMLGRFDGDRVALEELHRFPNEPVRLPGGLHWDAPRLFRETLRGIETAAGRGVALDAVAVDTWGVDYGLLDARGSLLGLPFHYRDERVAGMVAQVRARIEPDALYAVTGCQTLPLNTLYQLLAEQASPAFDRAATLLLLPDLLAYWLSGEIAAERTIASTTQLFDPRSGDWATEMLARLGIPSLLFPAIQPPGTLRGGLRDELAAETGAPVGLPVVATASHDTASAFAAQTSGPGTLVISSGTWSLVGIEAATPIVTPAARAANFTNEAGVAGTTRFLRNVAGMWLIQECRRAWAQAGQPHGYDALAAMAEAAPAFGPLIDPDDPAFAAPGDMPARIRAFCERSGQAAPTTPGATVRCALESLTLAYRRVRDLTERVTGQPIARLHIIGGGSRSALHCRLAADATGLPVLAGPEEATALGNVLVQAMALGAVGSLPELRDVIRRSFAPVAYPPGGDRARWDAAYERYLALIGG